MINFFKDSSLLRKKNCKVLAFLKKISGLLVNIVAPLIPVINLFDIYNNKYTFLITHPSTSIKAI